MINFDKVIGENTKEYNPHWPEIPNDPYRILTVGSCGSGKTNALLNLTNHQPNIDQIFLYAKDPYDPKYQYFIKKPEEVDLKHCKDIKTFMK